MCVCVCFCVHVTVQKKGSQTKSGTYPVCQIQHRMLLQLWLTGMYKGAALLGLLGLGSTMQNPFCPKADLANLKHTAISLLICMLVDLKQKCRARLISAFCKWQAV